jgi:hypothetical protein
MRCSSRCSVEPSRGSCDSPWGVEQGPPRGKMSGFRLNRASGITSPWGLLIAN